jgi:hypothetical protein
MAAASNGTRDNRERSSPKRKAARLSPEVDEVLRMLKTLEEQPEAPFEADPPASGKSRRS